MIRIEREFQIFTKPVGSLCNLQCNYCYYHGNKDTFLRNEKMNEILLEKYIIQHIKATTNDTIFFSWHVGEPTLAGIDFYRRDLVLQKKHLPPGKKLINGIQTNGTLLNDDW